MAITGIGECYLNDDTLVLFEKCTFKEFKKQHNIESNQYDDSQKGFDIECEGEFIFIPNHIGYNILELNLDYMRYCEQI